MAVKIRKFSEGQQELVGINCLPWPPYQALPNTGVSCTNLSVQSSGMSIGLAHNNEYGVGLYTFGEGNPKTAQLIKEIVPIERTINKKTPDDADEVYDGLEQPRTWQRVELVAHSTSPNAQYFGTSAYFGYSHENDDLFSNLVGQILGGVIDLDRDELLEMIAFTGDARFIYYQLTIGPEVTNQALNHWTSGALWPARQPHGSYTGRVARIEKIAFPNPRNPDNRLDTYVLDQRLAGPPTNPKPVPDIYRQISYVRDNRDATFQDITLAPSSRILYNICKRSHVISNVEDGATPIDVVDNETGERIPIAFPSLTDILTPTTHPLFIGADDNVRWSSIAHDRQNKYVLTSYHPQRQGSEIPFQGRIIVIPTSFSKPTQQILPISFVNATRGTGNNIVFVDEINKLLYTLSTATDQWSLASYPLHSRLKLFAPPDTEDKEGMLRDKNKYPLGTEYRAGNEIRTNAFHFYNEYATGPSDNLFPQWIDFTNNTYQIGEFSGDLWNYDNGFLFQNVGTSKRGAIDKSGNSILYNDGNTIDFVYNSRGEIFNIVSSDYQTTGWRCIASYPSASPSFQLLALRKERVDGKYIVDLFRSSGGGILLIRSYTLDGFELISPTGIVWGGTDHVPLIYVCDSGQRDHQIIKYNHGGQAFVPDTEMGSLTFEKVIPSPSARAEPATLDATCIDRVGVIDPIGRPAFASTIRREGDEVCVNLPLEGSESQKELFSGFLPINTTSKPISGKQLSLRIRITHNRYLDIGTVFVEASGPQVRN